MGLQQGVKNCVQNRILLLTKSNGLQGKKPDRPLLKDQFASERRKAKTLNFSIAYGKTARGLSKDWGVTLAEAEETLERWFADRPEGRKGAKEEIKKCFMFFICLQ